MKLTTRCSSCKKDILIKSQADTRPELQMEKGDIFEVNCQNCGTFEKKHVNDIVAESNKIMILIGVIISVLVTIFFWVYLRGFGTISAIIPLLFWQQQIRAVKSFNSFMIRRKS